MASVRDLTCIHSVSHMAEYGKYEEEFLVYGCSCLENNEIVYRVSPQYHEIAQFVRQAMQQRLRPSPVHTIMKRSIVQTGQHMQLLYETELSLAQMLQSAYPHLFFDTLQQCVQVEPSDVAKPVLDELRMQMNGIFSADALQLFEGLADLAYRAMLLSDVAWQEIQCWIQKIKRQMAYDIVAKKPFVRTFYGICYIDRQGRYQYKVNADELIVLDEQRKLKRQNIPVTPIFQKTYWYDYGVEPKIIREHFKKEITSYYDDLYWSYWRKIKMMLPVISVEKYQSALESLQKQSTKESYEAFQEYGYDWNVR